MEGTDSFREKLDKEYDWPALYEFKFITPQGMVDQVKILFPNHEVRERPSRNGNYISLSISMMARSSEEVINIYIEVHKLGGGIISL